MNALQLAASVDANFRQYWQCTNVPVEITTTWCADLVIAMYYEKNTNENGAILKTITDATATWKTDYEYFSQLIMAVNFLAWWTYESENYKDFSQFFSTQFYKLQDIAYNNFNEEDKAKLWQILD